MADVNDTLKQRGNKHGEFADTSATAQDLKHVMRNSKNWGVLKAFQKEALEMIAHKIARILVGDPDYADHWHDLQGYAKLVEDRVSGPAVVMGGQNFSPYLLTERGLHHVNMKDGNVEVTEPFALFPNDAGAKREDATAIVAGERPCNVCGALPGREHGPH